MSYGLGPDVTEFMPGGGGRKAANQIYKAFGLAKDLVKILQEAFRKAYNDPEFRANYKKLVGGEPLPLMPEELEVVLRELPRDPEIVELYKKVAGNVPLPPR